MYGVVGLDGVPELPVDPELPDTSKFPIVFPELFPVALPGLSGLSSGISGIVIVY